MRLLNKVKKYFSSFSIKVSKKRFKKILLEIDKITGKKLVVFIGHADYLISCGGTEKYQLEDVSILNKSGFDVIQIYPIPYNNKKLFGINFNEVPLSRGLSFIQIKDILLKVQNYEYFFSYNVHHLLGWDEQQIQWLTKTAEGRKIIVYLHDLYSLCPSKFLFYNDERYCGLLEKFQNKPLCDSCRYQTQLESWRLTFFRLFEISTHLVCPSNIICEAVNKTFNGFENKIRLYEHLTISNTDMIALKRPSGKIKVAYLGYKKDYKGWDLFEELYNDVRFRDYFDFYHVGSDFNLNTRNLKSVSYSFFEKRHAAVDALIDNQIDLVLLLSFVPESYSYTLHEAFAACVPVLALEGSGNIEYKINNHQIYGKVFPDFTSLRAFLTDRQAVDKFLAVNTKTCVSSLTHNSAFQGLLERGEI